MEKKEVHKETGDSRKKTSLGLQIERENIENESVWHSFEKDDLDYEITKVAPLFKAKDVTEKTKLRLESEIKSVENDDVSKCVKSVLEFVASKEIEDPLVAYLEEEDEEIYPPIKKNGRKTRLIFCSGGN